MEPSYPFENAFPLELGAAVKKIETLIGFHRYPYTERVDYFRLRDGENDLQLPVRVLFDEWQVEAYGQLNTEERIILNCMMTRHANGYLREKALREIIGSGYPWVIPYVFQLLGEYVGIIHLIILENYKLMDAGHLAAFLKANPAFYETTQRRAISYWNEYYVFYSNYPDRRDHPAIRALFEIEGYTGVPLSPQIFKKR